MRNSRGFPLLLALLSVPVLLPGQGMPLSTLAGHVTTEDGSPLEGVRVTVTSADLQGKREVSTSPSGDYIFRILPAGDYLVTCTRDGLQRVEIGVRLAVAGSARLDAVMRPASVEESVTVSAHSESAAPSDTTEIAANVKQKLADKLPIDRTLRSTVLLAPGVNDNGPAVLSGSASPRAGLMISGAPSYANLFLVNGVVVNENLSGQPQDLFIEDAIQETTVSTGRISAEYGRFTGGVVNMITKSGGNQFSGSFRTTFTNDRWTANNAFDQGLGLDNRVDQVNETYEATLGGPLWRDRIWFFGAGRNADLTVSRSTRPTFRAGDIEPTPIPYEHGTEERRLEGKVTAAISPRHNLIVSYIDFREDESNSTFNPNILDTAMLVPVEFRNSLLALSYNGVLSERFFLEAQYSRRRFSIEQGGPEYHDLIRGTTILDQSRRTGGVARYHSPVGKPHRPMRFGNETWFLKGSRFLSTSSLGSHDLRVGLERSSDSVTSDNHSSGSDFRVFGTSAIIRGTEVFPVFDAATDLEWRPVLEGSRGSELTTNSVFVNDHVVWNRRWSFNIGLRYDRNDDRDNFGFNVSRTDSWSPRLAARFDPRGNGRLALDLGYSRYVAKTSDTIAISSSPAGRAADLAWDYRGPCINCDPTLPTSQLIPIDQALQIVFDWFQRIGGTGSFPTARAIVPGLTTRIREGSLRSPSVKEYSFGIGTAFGSKGHGRADFLYRDFDDFYSNRLDLTTGRSAPDQFGNVYDVAEIENSNRLDRRYTAVQTQFRYSLSNRLSAGGSYTWSRLTGNFAGEQQCCSAQAGSLNRYPEYTQERWNFPTGYLSPRDLPGQPAADQRHRARVWLAWLHATRFGDLTATLLESYDSGRPYEAVGPIDPRDYVQNPGYLTPPSSLAYFFTRPAAFRTDDITRTDVALTWAKRVFKTVELFVKPELLNVFNEKGVIAVDTTVNTATNQPGFRPFNPFTDTPVRGPANRANPTANYDLGPSFGQPTSAAGYQLPRTFRLGVGLRF